MNPDAREEAVTSAIEARRELVNDSFEEYLPIQDPERLYEASRYLLDAGGKRLRPAILLLAAEGLTDVKPLSLDYQSFPSYRPDESPIDLMAAAVAVEIIQSFTLIHDDIMDDDDVRRGVAAVHVAFDEETAILAGDTLYSKAFEILLQSGAPAERTNEAIDRLASTCTRICEGQSLDVSFEDRADVSREEYLAMVDRKTAVLFAAAASIPMIILGAEDEQVEAMSEFGRSIGQAFQIQDDVLDLTVPSEKLGKQRGSDLVEGKRTLVTQHAREHGVDVDSLLTVDDPDAVTEADIEEAVSVLEEAGSIQFAKQEAERRVIDGKRRLEVFPDNEARKRLEDVADYLIERRY
ncbi:MAG: polyprenyl synthetase family protein [Halodesulfurarchaeum sp.]